MKVPQAGEGGRLLEIVIPSRDWLRLEHLVLDLNGTVALDGALLPGVQERVARLRRNLTVHLVSADTQGTLAAVAEGLGVSRTAWSRGTRAAQKAALVERLGADRGRRGQRGQRRPECWSGLRWGSPCWGRRGWPSPASRPPTCWLRDIRLRWTCSFPAPAGGDAAEVVGRPLSLLARAVPVPGASGKRGAGGRRPVGPPPPSPSRPAGRPGLTQGHNP